MTTGWVESDEREGGLAAAADIWEIKRATTAASARAINGREALFLGVWGGNPLNLATFTSIDLTSVGIAA